MSIETLNALRVKNNMKPLKSWKGSKAALEAAIKSLTPTKVRPFTTFCEEHNINPKVARNRLRRHGVEKPATGWTINAEVKKALGL